MLLQLYRLWKMQRISNKFLYILICLSITSLLDKKGVESKERLNPGTERDNMGRLDKLKMITLTEELIKDTKVKQRQVQHIRELYTDMVGYEVGMIMGKIREKYKRMLEIYRDAKDREAKNNPYRPPGYHLYKPLLWVINMETTRTLEVDIDKLVHILEMIPKESLRPAGGTNAGIGIPAALLKDLDTIHHLKPETPPHSEPDTPQQSKPDNTLRHSRPENNPLLRAGPLRTSVSSEPDTAIPNPTMAGHVKTNDTTALAVASKFADEEALKQHYRDAYNLRNGRGQNLTLDDYFGL